MSTLELTLKSGRMIKAEAFRGNKPCPWKPSGRHYQIIVEYFITPGNKKAFRFDFWDSYHNMTNVIPCDIRGALHSWSMDVYTGMNADSARDVASKFGYEDMKEGVRVFKGVKRAEGQFKQIEMSADDLQELADY